MYPKRSTQGDEDDTRPVRTSDRLRRRPKSYVNGRQFLYYMEPRRGKTKKKAPASRIAKMFGDRQVRKAKTSPVATNLRRSTRKRRISVNLEGFTDSSGTEDNDLMSPKYGRSRGQIENDTANQAELTPRRAGLRPRRTGLRSRHPTTVAKKKLKLESDDEQHGTSEEKAGQDEAENGNDDNDAEDEGDGEDDGEDEDGDDEEGEEEHEGRRRYDLRNRADVRRSIEEGSSKQRSRSPRRVLQQGMGTNKVNRDVRKGAHRVHKRHRMARADDSDDSLLVDELDQGPHVPWGGSSRTGGRSGPPWLLGGLDTHGTWGLNLAAASGWGHQSDTLAGLTSGVQTAGPSSKGGADIQPLQVDGSVSFEDIGGLSEYIDALKEMVFFPLLYPDFFASYNITPPRGVLLCGPPGTGKTLIARALASAASKAGQKVNFYMRKGADVLSKWVGEAERQLKLLFEEAQRNQPSIIFFDEIDGLAPVRSSKQEQIHNSIVSTLLALMDGLDSRGQVVLIGATNRVDAIDGALRRPGRFDREFNFPLPGLKARAEILDIHTRKWKQPPSNELKMELAASCVGYCGADLKALCTEAAIRAFREKYPQVYTSDDKFLIDVDSVEVQKHNFMEAMTTITPAAHRGSIVHSRPLSPVVAPCLQGHLRKAMTIISDIFPLVVSSELTRLSMLSYGSAVPLVYRPRILICGGEGTGLDHVGPAILHELEKFPVHSLGLASLLSDPGAKTPEEALVHIFSEARRTTPSVLYLPQFHLWWENAHDQLKAVLLTLLDELPSDYPILLFGTSSVRLSELEDNSSSVFHEHNVLCIDTPSDEDRSMFFDCLIESALSIQFDSGVSDKSDSLPELPKAPKVDTGPKASELKSKAEAQGHALRRMRMCLRDICNRILYDKRFSAFHFPVMDEDAPNYRSIIQNPMDIATLLHHVDSGKYITCKAYLDDFDLIVANAKKYNGDDYNGSRIVSRAYELRDSVHGMLSQMDPALVAFCEKIAAEGGPVSVPDEYVGSTMVPQSPILVTSVTRVSARLRNVQPEVNLKQSYEALKRPKKNVDVAHTASTSDEGSQPQESFEHKSPTQEQPEAAVTHADENMPETIVSDGQAENSGFQQDADMSDGEVCSKIESIKKRCLEQTKDSGIPQLERLYTRLMKGVLETKNGANGDKHGLKPAILSFLLNFVDEPSNFSMP
ncbi:unnamed protein product [Cuscuta epithymum]|uniref:Bromo domain-containing protein n=1 Tax=Cuscuta epithymum TaxID=186058 RepID=A0AAV0EZK8_9ASTE|nr:unnamed protein product [Cuscuta epithymum]CAH9128713.1 unnamed protein product [Cuscuta epithymum]